jgi:MFS transporter, putative metabolite:H+ symporter
MNNSKNVHLLILIAALGYFVDVYDLILFIIVRQPSLEALGYSGELLTEKGMNLLNLQMLGMLSGGIVWGMLGDKKGRLSVLFATILLYSLANIANGMITSLNQYYILRFIAGFGLAGELGVGVTLIAEVMSKESRGYGTTIVSGIGIAGAVAGFLVADLFNWRTAYYVGGGMGLLLLVLRVSVAESGMFHRVKQVSEVRRGSFISLLSNREYLSRYVRCILTGVPVWFVIGIFVTLASEWSVALDIQGTVIGSRAVMYHYIGASAGAFITGLISQRLQSRKKALLISLGGLVITLSWLLLSGGSSAAMFYFILLIIGIPNGYWSVFMSNASEQFGTNLRATVTTTAPNFVRGAIVLISMIFAYLKSGSLGFVGAAVVIGVVVIGIAIYATLSSDETFHKDLDYLESAELPALQPIKKPE